MNIETAEILCNLNNEFYSANSQSFSETRQTFWPGWKRGLDLIRADGFKQSKRLSVFDLACGNLRFELFLKKEFGSLPIEVFAVDNCDELVPSMVESNFCNLDIIKTLLSGESLQEHMDIPLCDLSVSFGFMHHVPGMKYRTEILKTLVNQTRLSGYVMVSFWQFLNNEELKKKAIETHENALQNFTDLDLDEGDYLLGWQNLPEVYRYCHNFSEPEIDQLAQSVKMKAKLLARYTSDGRGNGLNTYLIFKRVKF